VDQEQLEYIRGVVLATLTELGMPEADWSLVSETTLLRDRSHPGRRFQYHAVRAVWFADARVIEFFSADGLFLKTVPLGPEKAPKQAAA
jgi:hypothetical protein